MTIPDLASALRERQLAAGVHSAATLDAFGAAELVGCYTDCPHCLGPLFPDPAAAVRDAADEDAFIAACNAAI